ncbi:hypothetical protein O1M63_28805 [Streptomyces mirabilis]|nr:hypothetical protein [Streptomyces mirabilis]
MTIRGKVAVAALVCAAGIAAAVLAWPTAKPAPGPPTSDEIKASAQAALDSSKQAGREAQQVILGKGYTPSEELCQAVWDRKTKAEQHDLLYTMWMIGCADTPQ